VSIILGTAFVVCSILEEDSISRLELGECFTNENPKIFSLQKILDVGNIELYANGLHTWVPDPFMLSQQS
jgi:hypothetical protein